MEQWSEAHGNPEPEHGISKPWWKSLSLVHPDQRVDMLSGRTENFFRKNLKVLEISYKNGDLVERIVGAG
jgi:hypothetical protein